MPCNQQTECCHTENTFRPFFTHESLSISQEICGGFIQSLIQFVDPHTQMHLWMDAYRPQDKSGSYITSIPTYVHVTYLSIHTQRSLHMDICIHIHTLLHIEMHAYIEYDLDHRTRMVYRHAYIQTVIHIYTQIWSIICMIDGAHVHIYTKRASLRVPVFAKKIDSRWLPL